MTTLITILAAVVVYVLLREPKDSQEKRLDDFYRDREAIALRAHERERAVARNGDGTSYRGGE